MRCRPGVSWMAANRSARSGLSGRALPSAPTAAAVGRHLAGDLVDGAGALAAAAVGDDAVGAELVAAVDHGDEGGGPLRLGEGLRPELAAEVGVRHEVAEDHLEGLGPRPDVDIREAGGEDDCSTGRARGFVVYARALKCAARDKVARFGRAASRVAWHAAFH